MKSRVEYSYRICFVNFKNKNNMRSNIESRYYYEFVFICIESNIMRIIKKIRKIFFSKHDILSKTSTLKKIIFDFDIIISRSSDFAHNKHFEIIQRIMFVLYMKILISKTFEAFIKEFRFIFLLMH